MSERDLGRLGEFTLAQWCAQVGITANRSEQDKSGWDYLLEFPLRLGQPGAVAFDLLPMPLSCRVQVKSTDFQKRRVSVALSNLMRLVQNPLPAFFLILEFDGNERPTSAYLVHVADDLIYAVLKRLREVSANPNTHLHRTQFSIRYGSREVLEGLSGIALSQRIEEYIGGSPASYVERKMRVVQTAGYDEWRSVVKAVVHVPEDAGQNWQEKLVDATLGLAPPELELTSFQTHDVRFGIESPPLMRVDGGKLLLNPRIEGQGNVCFACPKLVHEVKIPCDVYFPRGLGKIVTAEYLKLRFDSPILKFSLWPVSNRWHMRVKWPDQDHPVKLNTVKLVAEVIQMLNLVRLGGHSYTIDFQFDDLRHGGNASQPPEIDDSFVMVAKLLASACSVAAAAGMSDRLSLRLIDLAPQAQRFELLENLLTSNLHSFSWEFCVASCIPDEVEVATALVIPVQFADDYLMIGFALTAKPKLTLFGRTQFEYSAHSPEVEFISAVREPATGNPTGVRQALLHEIGMLLENRPLTIYLKEE